MQKLINYIKPLYSVVWINIIGFALLYLYKKPFDVMTIAFGLVVITVIYLTYFFILIKKLGDEYLFLISSMLISLGIIMLYRLSPETAVKQIVWLLASIILFFFSYLGYTKFNTQCWPALLYTGVSIGLFLITLAFGRDIKGANNWIVVGRFSMQPSEIIKILFVFFLASYYVNPEQLNISKLGKMGKGINAGNILSNKISSIIRSKINKIGSKTDGKTVETDFNRIIFSMISYSYFGFLVLQQEWGSALLFFMVYFVFLYIFNTNRTVLLANAGVAIIGGLLGYLYVYHIRIRVEIWLNPWKDIANKGYQIAQSLFAIGNGGFFGTGLGMGRPDFIPEVQTDFIFSAICEEMGIFGGTAIILMFFIFVYRGFKISFAAKDPFDKAVACGLTLMFGFQTFIILGGVIKFIPLTGITLPFISYGGSSLVTSFISLGILQAISKKANF